MRKLRWVGVGQLSDETGFSVRAIQYIAAREPDVLRTRNGKQGMEFEQPTCAVALRKREAEKAAKKGKPESMNDAELRMAVAQAEMAELKLAELRRQLMTVADYDKAVTDAMARVDAKLKHLPQRLAGVPWAVDLVAKVGQATPIVDEVRAELWNADDVPDEETAA